MSEPDDKEERLKSALWFAVGKRVDEYCLESNASINATPQFIAQLATLVWDQIATMAGDLEDFSRHAGRTTVTVDDTLLLVRRNEDLHGMLKEHIDQLRAERVAKGGKKK